MVDLNTAKPIFLTKMRAEATINEDLASVTFYQTFVNTLEAPADAVYLLRKAGGFVTSSVTCSITESNGRTRNLEISVVSISDARVRNGAAEPDITPIMHTSEGESIGIYTQRLFMGIIPPLATIEISFVCYQLLERTDRGFTFQFPTSYIPSYLPAMAECYRLQRLMKGEAVGADAEICECFISITSRSPFAVAVASSQ